MSGPLISVIVPVHDVAGHVGACIESLRAQSLRDFEVVVIDDGSTDDSAARARAAAAGDERFVFLAQDNRGLSAARNAGLARARGRFIAFVDSDDRVAPEYLQALHEALCETGADWASCAIRFCHADGRAQDHSGLHGAPELEAEAPPERHVLDDWRAVARHFPSAWNKLYRRELIGDIRFDEGMIYEDHAFFWRCAARTDHLLRLSRPLYWHSRGRPGQLTRAGDERVFQQFEVLDQLARIVAGEDPALSGSRAKAGGSAALAQIATRTGFERVQVIADARRRARFVARMRDWLAGHDLAPDAALGVAAGWISVLEGRVPVSVVLPVGGPPELLAASLEALAAQTLPGIEVIAVPDEARLDGAARARLFALAGGLPAVSVLAGARGLHRARNRGLAAARGEAVLFLDAGDTLAPGALMAWHNRLWRAGADIGFARLQMGGGAVHPGLHDAGWQLPEGDEQAAFAPRPEDAVTIHAHPSAKLWRRDFLRAAGLEFGPEPLASWDFLLRGARRARRMVRLGGPAARIDTSPPARRLWRAPVEAGELAAAVRRMAAAAELEPALAARLWVRAVWEKVNFADFPDPAARAAFEAEAARLSRGWPELATVAPDPYVGARLRRLLGLAPA